MANTVNNNNQVDRMLAREYWRGHNEALTNVLEMMMCHNFGYVKLRNDIQKLHKETSQNWKNFL